VLLVILLLLLKHSVKVQWRVLFTFLFGVSVSISLVIGEAGLFLTGNSTGQSNYGEVLRDGEGVPVDGKEAAAWFLKSAEQKNQWGTLLTNTSSSFSLFISLEPIITFFLFGVTGQANLGRCYRYTLFVDG
jgi:TPR repeat protein